MNGLIIITFVWILIAIYVGFDAHERNKYSTPWFLLTGTISLFGVLFYYVNIRTEEQTDSVPKPSTLHKFSLLVASVVGSFLACFLLIGLSTGPYTIVFYVFSAVCLSLSLFLYLDLKSPYLQGEKLFVECIYALGIGGGFSLTVFSKQSVQNFMSSQVMNGLFIVTTLAFPVVWYSYRTKISHNQIPS